MPEALWRGVVLFDAGLYFECHEHLEGVWHRAPAADRDFYQGIILVAAAFYHFEKGNTLGARRSLEKALPQLEAYFPQHSGVGTAGLARLARRWLDRLRAPDAGRPGEDGVLRARPRIPLAT